MPFNWIWDDHGLLGPNWFVLVSSWGPRLAPGRQNEGKRPSTPLIWDGKPVTPIPLLKQQNRMCPAFRPQNGVE